MDIKQLQDIVGADYVITDRDHMQSYLCDETVVCVRPKPAEKVVVVKPGNAREISEILKLANLDKTPVFIRGGGTGLCGGAIPTRDGLLISMERLNKVIELDADNLMITVEAGVTLADILKAADGAGLFFPPHPGDEGAQAGGMVALNAGGTRAVKYGVTRSYVKGLEAVLPTGEIVNFGGKLIKNNQGFDLLQLMINSTGLLGVITKITFRLYPKPEASATLVVSYNNRYDAINTVPKILRSGTTPLAIEFFERDIVMQVSKKIGVNWPVEKGTAYLMIILTGTSEDDMFSQAEKIAQICEENKSVDVQVADKAQMQADILKLRSEFFSIFKDRTADALDITVPPANIGKLLEKVDEVAKKYNTTIPTYGHAGDGNLHAHILKEIDERGQLKQVKREIYQETLNLGGVLTGEHGIGQIRNKDLDLVPDKKQWELMWGIKKTFDPNNILSPGVGLPPNLH
ncbi:MAG: FAD-binding oxidoreductase [Dehalococcoidales bacterium]